MNNNKSERPYLVVFTKMDGSEVGSFSVLNPPHDLVSSLIEFWKVFDSDEEVRDQVLSVYEQYVSLLPHCWLTNDTDSLWEPGLRSIYPVMFEQAAPGKEARSVSVQILGLNAEDELKVSDDKLYAEFYEKFIEIVESCSN